MKKLKMIEIVEDQIKIEFGEEWDAKEIDSKRMLMAAMKWGVRSPELTHSELNAIYKEESDAR